MSDDTIWTSSTFPKRTYTLPKLKEELDVRQKALNDVHELYFNHSECFVIPIDELLFP